MTQEEILVIGGEPPSGRWPVVSTVEEGVAVVRAPSGDLPEIARHVRFAVARRSDGEILVAGDERALDDLSEGARLFVTAWRARPVGKPDRPGEGMSWGAAGFEPPDRPES